MTQDAGREGPAQLDEVGKLLARYQGSGKVESIGEFTVDLQRAYQQLARHVFSDANEYILKLVQAANLLHTPLRIEHKQDTNIIFDDWPAALGVQRVAEALCRIDFAQQWSPLGLLAQGLRGLLGLTTTGVEVRHTVAGLPGRDLLSLGSKVSLSLEPTLPTRNSRLRLSVPRNPALSAAKTELLLKTRCEFSGVPIHFNGELLAALDSLGSLGSHRPKGFSKNTVLAQSLRPSYRSYSISDGGRISDRWAVMRLTVDLDPLASVWFCAAGVLTHQRRVDFGVPGITAVVAADDLPADIGGFHLRESDQLRAVEGWLSKRARRLMTYALQWLQSEQGLQDRRFAEATRVLVSYSGWESDDPDLS